MNWWVRARLRTKIFIAFSSLIIAVLLATLGFTQIVVSREVERTLDRELLTTGEVFEVLLKERGARKRKLGGGAGWMRRPGVWLAAAAATVLLAAGVFWSVQQNQAPVTPLARAELSPVDQHSATGSARVVEAKDGQRTLEVQVNKNEARGYQEVWLIAPDLSRLVSLGVMTSGSGTFPVPAGLNLSEYPIVDVSDEPVDGNPAHSSVSIVRGTLVS